MTSTNGRGYATSHQYDLFDRRTRTTNALSAYASFALDKASNLTLVEAYDAASNLVARTTNSFDEVDRLWQVVRDRFGSGLQTSYPTTVDHPGRRASRDPGDGPLERKHLLRLRWRGKALDRDARERGPGRVHPGRERERHGQSRRPRSRPSGPSETYVTEFDFDVLNRMVEKREIDRLNNQNILTTTFAFDSRSDLVFRVDAEGNPVRWTYDLASRLVKYERALQVGQTIDDFVTSIDEMFAYDDDNRLVEITDDNFESTAYTYDALSRRTRTTYADSRYVEYLGCERRARGLDGPERDGGRRTPTMHWTG